MSSKCFYCGKKCKNLKAHTEAKHPGKASRGMPQRRRVDRSDSIASEVIDAKLREAMGCPEKYDEHILEGFE